MSRKIDLKDAKEGMWIEFDDADGHYAGELHEMRDSEDIIHSLILSMSDPDVYLEVQHPCWSCNSNSSSANASAGVR